jgi:hypothetical protein
VEQVIPLVPQRAPRRAFEGASRTVIPASGVGAIVGLVTGIPVVMTAGAGAILGIVLGATLGLIYRD